MMDTILIIEDDEGISRGICFTLTKENYKIILADSLNQGRQVLRMNKPDLILLDVNLPDGDGYTFCKEIREELNVPIIMLTARDLETDQIIGLTVGADDYITKPFSISVLKARIAAQLRRYHLLQEGISHMKKQWLVSANIRLCKDNCKVYKSEEEVDLSVTEYRLLKLFLEHQGQILLKEQILEAVWDTEGNFVDENTLPVNIRRLRLKLEEDPSRPELIKTVHGMGYIWAEGAVRDED